MPNPGLDSAHSGRLASPPLVAVAGWLLPGAGYWLIGERARALTVGVAIVGLFLLGIAIGGVRAIQVPGYGENGRPLYLAKETRATESGRVRVLVSKEAPPDAELPGPPVVTDLRALLRDVGNKPWSICQVLAGPVALAGGAWSVSASRLVERPDGTPAPAGVLSHSRINEIAVLYTAVAGMLNLMVIIDAAARAARQPGSAPATGSSSRSPFASRPEAA